MSYDRRRDEGWPEDGGEAPTGILECRGGDEGDASVGEMRAAQRTEGKYQQASL